MAIYLGVDIGTTSTKCLAVDEDGSMLALAQRRYPMTHPHQDWAEQDPEDYWRALVDVIGQCVAQCKEQGRGAHEVGALAMSTQGDTLIVADDAGNPLIPAISWMDARPDAECHELMAEADSSFWYRETGSPMNRWSSACSIRWLAKHMPELKSKGARYCYVPDFLAKRLCGEFVTDVPSASWSPLFTPSRRDWSKPVLELLGIDEAALPRTLESGEVIGRLSPSVAVELGLAPETVLVAGAFDQTAAACGAGASAGGRSVLSCGTAWVLYSVSSSPVIDQNEQLCTCCHAKRDEWGLVLPFSGGSTYDWLLRTFGENGDSSKSDSEPPIFIPHLYGGASPDWHGESKGSLVGLTMSHTREDIRLSLMRGLAFEARRNLEAGELFCGGVQFIRMVGGAGKSDIWPQMIANALGRPVEVSDCVESACFGAARMAAGKASSEWTVCGSPREFTPVPAQVTVENRLYHKYISFYETLLSVYGSDTTGKD